jgi:aminoglycoside/choline kinase family phosphotransferase
MPTYDPTVDPAVTLPSDELQAVLGVGDPAVVGIEALYEPVASATAGIWRVHAGTRTAVLKLLAPDDGAHPHWRAGHALDHWYYWRREALAYESGLLRQLGGGLRAPACHLVRERDDGRIALWLEDVDTRAAVDWPLDEYAVAARRLGHAQGAFVRAGVPDDAWLSRHWLRRYLEQRADVLAEIGDDDIWRAPRVAAVFDVDTVARARALHDQLADNLDALDREPRTLCHFDLHPKNLFDDGATTTVIDWAFVGVGTIADDPATLIGDAVFDFHVVPDDVDALHALVVDGYTRGLHDAGCTDLTHDHVQRAIARTTAARYVWIAPATARALRDDRPLLNRRPTAEALPAWMRTLQYVFDHGLA